MLDGLGANEVEGRPGILRELAAMDGTQITTVVPSTTSTALTSIATGLAPAQHGILGFRMLVDDEVLNVLRKQTQAAGARPIHRSAPRRLLRQAGTGHTPRVP